MPSGDHELRLLWALLLNGLVFFSAWRLTLRFTSGSLAARLADTFLLAYMIQYVAVATPGLAGVLSPLTISTAAVACSAVFLILSRPPG